MTKIAVSSGDPAGVGPDICIKAFGQGKIKPYYPIIFGNIDLFRERAKLLNINIDLQQYNGEDLSSLSHDSFWIVDQPLNTAISPGIPSPASAAYTMRLFEDSVKRTISNEFDAIVTCPINKKVINLSLIHI